MTHEYTRRSYKVSGDDLDKVTSIRLQVLADGQKLIDIPAPEPGMVAFVSKESEQGFDVEVVEATGIGINDLDAGEKKLPHPWQQMALDL